jgi:hypothetical protein
MRISTPGRNERCTCGSGKKYKHCCFGRKPLSHVAGVEFETPQVLEGARIEPDGRITFIYANKEAKQRRPWIATYRERKKGEKTLVKVDTKPAELRFGEIHALQKYDFVFAIDTNSRRIGENLVSAAHVMQLRFKSENELEHSTLGAFVFANVSERQENLAWLLLCDEILRSPSYRHTNTYGIITDSDLGNHDEYNKRGKPIHADEFLPENFTILYASDEGNGIANQLIRQCDKKSAETLSEVESGTFEINRFERIQNAPFTHLIRIFNTNTDFERSGWFQLLRPPALSKHS